jgi:hypothetical protein
MSAFEKLTSAGYQVLLPLFELFTNRGVPIALSLGFFVVFGLASVWLVWLTERPRRQIKQVAGLLRRIEGQREFTTALPEVAESMGQRGILQHAWSSKKRLSSRSRRSFLSSAILPYPANTSITKCPV